MIRKASIEDIPAIREMADVAFRQTYKDILSPEQMEYMMDWMYSESSLARQMSELGHVFFIEDNKGYVSFRFERQLDNGIALFHLEKLYVMPECRASGLGRLLFDKVSDSVRLIANGPARIELNVNRNNPAVGFYEHIGLQKAGSGDFPIGHGFYMNDYIMAVDIC